MAILDIVTLGAVKLYVVDADPTITGVTAPLGSLILLSDGTGIYQKTNTAATNWSKGITLANLADITTAGTITTGTWSANTIVIAKGGTNSTTALNNNRIMVSSAGAIVELAAMTAGRIAFYDTNGLPFFNTLLRWDDVNARMGVGASAGSGFRLNVVGDNSGTALKSDGVSVSAFQFDTSSTTVPVGFIRNTDLTNTPRQLLQLTRLSTGASSGMYIQFKDSSGTNGIHGQFGTIVTDATAGTMKSAFVWSTPNEINETIVERMRLTSAGLITLATWNGTAVSAAFGGTGQTTYAIGDILQASAATTLSKLAAVATGNVLISGGVTTVSSWGKVGLATHVSGNLPVTNLNAGTSASSTTFWRGDGTWGIPASVSVSDPLTTKGDIWTFTTVDAKLPVGTDAQILVADSTTATGLKWVSGSALTNVAAGGNQFFFSQANIGTAAGPVFVQNDGTAPGATDSIATGTRQIITKAGNISTLYVGLTTAPGGVTSRVISVYKNGVITTLSTTITGAATTGNNTGTAVAVAAGDTVSVGISNTGAVANSDGIVVSFLVV